VRYRESAPIQRHSKIWQCPFTHIQNLVVLWTPNDSDYIQNSNRIPETGFPEGATAPTGYGAARLPPASRPPARPLGSWSHGAHGAHGSNGPYGSHINIYTKVSLNLPRSWKLRELVWNGLGLLSLGHPKALKTLQILISTDVCRTEPCSLCPGFCSVLSGSCSARSGLPFCARRALFYTPRVVFCAPRALFGVPICAPRALLCVPWALFLAA